jgi:hypothetical protein
MSKTLFIEYGGDGFWAYDVAIGIFLKHLIDCARSGNYEGKGWLPECVECWRVNAVLTDCGIRLNEDWTQEQLQTIHRIIDCACRTLAASQSISAMEMESWDIVDGQGINARGNAQFPTEPVVELGQAVQALLRGTLPRPPDGEWWFYGGQGGRSTIAKKV